MPKNTSGLKRGGGRAKGVPNKATSEVRDLCERLLNRPEYFDSLQRRLDKGKLPPAVETMLWHYWRGKPKETVEVTGSEGGPITFTINIANAGQSDL